MRSSASTVGRLCFPAALREFRPDIVIAMSGGLWDLQDAKLSDWEDFQGPGDQLYDDWMISRLSSVVADLGASRVPVLWLTIPCPGRDQLTPQLRRFSAMSLAGVRHFNAHILPAVAARHREVMQIVDLDGRICPGGRLAMKLEPARARPDGLHYSYAGAAEVVEWLGPIILDAVRRRF